MLETELEEAEKSGSRWSMIVLHGLGDSMEGYRWLPEMLAVPELNYLLLNAPDSYFGGYSWYDYAQNPGPGILRSRALLTELLDHQRAEGFPTEQTFLFGFSQGCLMTVETGLRYPHRLAGLIGISGYVHEPERLLNERSVVASKQRILMTHGTLDPLIPVAPVRSQVEMLRSAGMNIEWREFVKVHTIAGEDELSVIRKFVRQIMDVG